MAVERREELGIAGERAVGPLPRDEEVDSLPHGLRMRSVAMRLPGSEKRQQSQPGDAMVAPRSGTLAVLPLHRPLHAGPMPGGGPATVA